MSQRGLLQSEILDLIAEIWDLEQGRPFGRLLHEVLQPKDRAQFLYALEDELLLAALDSYLSVAEARAKHE